MCFESITIPDSVTSICEHAFGYVYENKIDDFKIYGYAGTSAEKYANDNGFEFVDLDKEKEPVESEYSYNILDDGTAEITGCSGEDTDLLIPSEINSHKVTSIGYCAFLD